MDAERSHKAGPAPKLGQWLSLLGRHGNQAQRANFPARHTECTPQTSTGPLLLHGGQEAPWSPCAQGQPLWGLSSGMARGLPTGLMETTASPFRPKPPCQCPSGSLCGQMAGPRAAQMQPTHQKLRAQSTEVTAEYVETGFLGCTKELLLGR